MDSRAANFPASMPVDGDASPARRFRAIAVLGTAILLAISLVPRDGPTSYDHAYLFLVPLVCGVYGLRRRLHLLPAHFGAFVSAVVLHDLGAFGCYHRGYFGLEFDFYVHSYFGFVGSLIVARFVDQSLRPAGLQLAVIVLLVVTGFGGFHEIMEAASTLLPGGMDWSPHDPFDTEKDLTNNVLGALAGLIVHGRRKRRFLRASAPARRAADVAHVQPAARVDQRRA